MYPYHSTTSLTLRAKLSFSNNHHLSIYNNDNCSYCYASQPPTLFYTAPRNPRFIYYGYLLRREASLFQFESSRTFVLPRRGARVCHEAIGLLEEKERRCCCCCRCCGGEGFRSGDGSLERSSRKEGSWKGNFGKSLKKEGSWSGDEERFSRKEKIRNGEGGGGSRRSDHTSVKKSSFLRDAEEKGVERRRVVGESSSRGGRKKDYGVSRVDVEEKVVREVRNLEGEVKFGRDSRHEKNEFDYLKGSAREAREESVYKEPERSRRQIGIHARNESANNSSSRREDYDLRIRDEEENFEDRWDTGREAKEESVYKEQEKSRMQQGFHGRDGRSKVSSSRKEVYDLRIRDEEENVEDWMDSRRIEREGHVQEGKLNRSSFRDRYSNYRNESSVRNVDKGESSTSFVSLQSEVDQKAVNQAELRKSSFRESNIERVSTSQRHFEEEKVKNREGRFGSVTNLVEGSRDERTQNDRRTIERMELNKQYETHHSDSRFHLSDRKGANSSESYVEIKGYNGSSSSSRRHIEEERVKDREDRFNSVKNVVQVLGDERIESNEQKETDKIDSRIHLSDKERANTSGSYVEIKVSDGISSSLQKRQDEERIKSREDRATKTENLIQLRRDERTQVSQQSIDKTEFDEQNENQTIPSKIYVSGNESVNNKKSSVQIRTDERINLQEMSTTRIDNQKETSSQMKETQVSIGCFHGGSSSALESANRLDESSATYVGEFVNKLRQETSALDSSKISKEKTVMGTNQEATIVEVSEEKYTEEGGRQSSSRSGMKGPTDEMWEIKGLSSSNQPYKIEEPEDDSTEVVGSKISPEIAENAIARRSHRSLWAYIADVMKIGWGHRARSHNSNQKPGPRSSSNESFSSEAWFSGHEPDENDDEFKKEKDASPKELVPSKQKQLGEQSTQVDLSASLSSVRRGEEVQRGEGETRDKQMHGSGSQKPEEEFGRQKYPEVSGIEESDGILGRRNSWTKELVTKGSFVQQFHPLQSTSLGIMNTSSPSKVDFKPMEGGRGRNVTISSVDQPSVSIPGIVAPSVSEIGSVKMAETGGGELEGEIIIEKVPEIGGTEERDGELKRRKLQRNKQVLREQFDEWEEAYKREIEQRKIDEFFMREALLEAKKAGDTWEVPVGAVLVQNGKIIARGCNLVEELRDSTAHAEMICIRAASNLLRSWRLAETTLYVTLEPCAMCAGAILQARIDTVVWGAPNKLLGADGSWVRLFPSGDGGTTSTLDPPNQMVGPVHPFHPKITIRRGVLATECSEVMQQFFQLRRRKKNITKPEQPSPPPSRLHVSAHPTKLFAKMHDLFCIMFCL